MANAGTIRPTSCATPSELRSGDLAWRSAHLVGICGSGMKALAELLTVRGWSVSGSDLNAGEGALASLSRRGLRIHSGHHGRFLAPQTDVLVYSPAVGPDNAER